MSSFLVCVGEAAGRMLPDVVTAMSCGAAKSPEKLHIFALSSGHPDYSETEALISGVSACRSEMLAGGEPGLFPCDFSFSSCTPVFRSLKDLSADPEAYELISVLRGKGLPLSLLTDRDAVEWCFSDLLHRPDDPSIQPFISWIKYIKSENGTIPDVTIAADLSDPFSAGIALVLMNGIRELAGACQFRLYLLGLADPVVPVSETYYSDLGAVWNAIESRALLRSSENDPSPGADAAWMISIPASLKESAESFRFVSLAAARVLGMLSSGDIPSPGLHTRETEGTVSLSALRDEAPCFFSFLRFSVWALTELIPSLRSWLSHPVRLRSIAPGARNALLRQLFSGLHDPDLPGVIDRAEKTLQDLIRNILRFMRSVPSSMRLSADFSALWQKAVNACGRYITVASEYDVSSSEAHESGIDTVRPVHRVSMADTEEEQLLHRLEQMRQQMEEEEKNRNTVLSALGGYRSLQARADCLKRCREALKEAEKKSFPDGADNLTILKQERRIRLLQAAVDRCVKELDPDSVRKTLSLPPESRGSVPVPYEGIPLDPDACRMLESLISTPENASSLRFSKLFSDWPERDQKSRMKDLQNLCRNTVPIKPFPFMLARALDICREESSSCRFLSPGVMPALPLLPGLIPDTPVTRIRDLVSLLPETAVSDDVSEQRGLLSMLLLRQYRRRSSDEAQLHCLRLEGGSSPVVRYWLSAHHADKAYVVSLGKKNISMPFALIIPGCSFIPARRTVMHTKLIPAYATWFDADKNAFSDPCSCLGESDAKLLHQLLSSFNDALPKDADTSLCMLLHGFLQDLSRHPAPYSESPFFRTRLRAVYGLRSIPAYESALSVVSCCYEHFLSSDPVGSCLTGTEDFPASSCTDIPEDVLYLYRDVPFARDDSRLLLSSPHAAGEDYTLKHLEAECAVLSESSDDYRDALAENLRSLLEKKEDAIPEVREAAEALVLEVSSPVEKKEPTFVWPWDTQSPSIRTILTESVGAALSASAMNPFSDYLSLFPARGRDVIGDTLFSSMCSVMPAAKNQPEGSDISPDAVLPPLSPEFCRILCRLPEGRTLLQPGLLAFERREDDSLRVTLTLDGMFPVHLIREYLQEEILYLYAHDIPTIAVWPSVPFRPEDWKAYFVYAHLPETFSVSVLSESGGYTDVPVTNGERHVAILESFPACAALFRENRSAGVIPNILPGPIIHESDPVEICLDFGSSGTSVVFSSSRKRRPMQGPVMVRTLISNPASSRDLLRREFIPAVPVSALLPTVTRIFRNVPGAVPEPFADGMILMSSDLKDLLSTPSDAVYTSLKWEEEKGRSGFLCLHQVLLMSALQARFEGASAVGWRFSLPDEMAKEGRESLMSLFRTLCENVLRMSGYPVPPEGLPVAFASDSSALGAYFRCCASEDTRGGFMVLDLGACTADISLFMRGREQAIRTCQLPLGIHYMLLPSLLRDPDLPAREFGFCKDETFSRDLSLLCRALRSAGNDTVALRRARVALDYFVADHLSLMINCSLQLSSAGMPSRLSALLLLHLSYLLMLSGLVLLQLAADPNRNDFLPEQMTLCLSGRGSILLESFPAPLKNSLCHFLSMFRNRRVASLSLLFSSEKKMEIPVGLSMLQEVYHMLPPASAVPASIAVRPAALLPEFLLRFRQQFPLSAETLFPGFFMNDGYHPFTERGESLITASIDQSFPPSDNPRPYDCLSAWIGNLLDLVS